MLRKDIFVWVWAMLGIFVAVFLFCYGLRFGSRRCVALHSEGLLFCCCWLLIAVVPICRCHGQWRGFLDTIATMIPGTSARQIPPTLDALLASLSQCQNTFAFSSLCRCVSPAVQFYFVLTFKLGVCHRGTCVVSGQLSLHHMVVSS